MNKSAAIAAALQQLPASACSHAIADAVVGAVGPDAALDRLVALAQSAWESRQKPTP